MNALSGDDRIRLRSLADLPHDHAGHDHAGHDHAGHDHAGHDHAGGGPRLPWGLLIALVVVTAIGVRYSGANWDDARELLDMLRPPAQVEVDGKAYRVPSPGATAGRLIPAVESGAGGAYAFMRVTADGRPIGYDPCQPVRWVLNDTSAPDGARPLLDAAVASISAATGLAFEYAGTTDEPAALDRAVIQPDRYGTMWAPVLIAWTSADTLTELDGQIAGMGGSAVVPGADGRGQWLAAGRVVLDSDDLGAWLANGETELVEAVILHELGHVVGLDHVDDPTQIMYPTTGQTFGLGAGDLAGLALVGQAACQ